RGFMVTEQRRNATGVFVLTHVGGGGFFQRATQQQGNNGSNGADHEWNPPAIGFQLVGIEKLLQDDHGQDRQQLAANQRHVLEGREETTLPPQRDFTHVRRSGAVFAPDREALKQAREEQQ